MPMRKAKKFGEKAENTLKRFKGVEMAPSLISIVDKVPNIAALHFEEGIGSFFCFEGICCKKSGSPRTYYILPVVSYRIKDFDTMTPDLEGAEIQYLRVSESVYDNLIKIEDAYGDLEDMDIQITTEDEKFQRFVIKPVINHETGLPKKASWRHNDALRNKVVSYLEKSYEEDVEMSLGKQLTPKEYMDARGNANSGPKVPDPPQSEDAEGGGNNVPPPPDMGDGGGKEGEEEDIPFSEVSEEEMEVLYE